MKNNISLKKRFLSLVTAGVLGFSYVPTFAEGIATPTDLESEFTESQPVTIEVLEDEPIIEGPIEEIQTIEVPTEEEFQVVEEVTPEEQPIVETQPEEESPVVEGIVEETTPEEQPIVEIQPEEDHEPLVYTIYRSCELNNGDKEIVVHEGSNMLMYFRGIRTGNLDSDGVTGNYKVSSDSIILSNLDYQSNFTVSFSVTDDRGDIYNFTIFASVKEVEIKPTEVPVETPAPYVPIEEPTVRPTRPTHTDGPIYTADPSVRPIYTKETTIVIDCDEIGSFERKTYNVSDLFNLTRINFVGVGRVYAINPVAGGSNGEASASLILDSSSVSIQCLRGFKENYTCVFSCADEYGNKYIFNIKFNSSVKKEVVSNVSLETNVREFEKTITLDKEYPDYTSSNGDFSYEVKGNKLTVKGTFNSNTNYDYVFTDSITYEVEGKKYKINLSVTNKAYSNCVINSSFDVTMDHFNNAQGNFDVGIMLSEPTSCKTRGIVDGGIFTYDIEDGMIQITGTKAYSPEDKTDVLSFTCNDDSLHITYRINLTMNINHINLPSSKDLSFDLIYEDSSSFSEIFVIPDLAELDCSIYNFSFEGVNINVKNVGGSLVVSGSVTNGKDNSVDFSILDIHNVTYNIHLNLKEKIKATPSATPSATPTATPSATPGPSEDPVSPISTELPISTHEPLPTSVPYHEYFEYTSDDEGNFNISISYNALRISQYEYEYISVNGIQFSTLAAEYGLNGTVQDDTIYISGKLKDGCDEARLTFPVRKDRNVTICLKRKEIEVTPTGSPEIKVMSPIVKTFDVKEEDTNKSFTIQVGENGSRLVRAVLNDEASSYVGFNTMEFGGKVNLYVTVIDQDETMETDQINLGYVVVTGPDGVDYQYPINATIKYTKTSAQIVTPGPTATPESQTILCPTIVQTFDAVQSESTTLEFMVSGDGSEFVDLHLNSGLENYIQQFTYEQADGCVFAVVDVQPNYDNEEFSTGALSLGYIVVKKSDGNNYQYPISLTINYKLKEKIQVNLGAEIDENGNVNASFDLSDVVECGLMELGDNNLYTGENERLSYSVDGKTLNITGHFNNKENALRSFTFELFDPATAKTYAVTLTIKEKVIEEEPEIEYIDLDIEHNTTGFIDYYYDLSSKISGLLSIENKEHNSLRSSITNNVLFISGSLDANTTNSYDIVLVETLTKKKYVVRVSFTPKKYSADIEIECDEDGKFDKKVLTYENLFNFSELLVEPAGEISLNNGVITSSEYGITIDCTNSITEDYTVSKTVTTCYGNTFTYNISFKVKEKTPVPTATPTSVPTSTPVPTVTPTSVPTSTPVPTVTPTSVPTSTPVPTVTEIDLTFCADEFGIIYNIYSVQDLLGCEELKDETFKEFSFGDNGNVNITVSKTEVVFEGKLFDDFKPTVINYSFVDINGNIYNLHLKLINKIQEIDPTIAPTNVPTSTPVPTATPTSVPTATPTSVPTSTPVPTNTVAPTATPRVMEGSVTFEVFNKNKKGFSVSEKLENIFGVKTKFNFASFDINNIDRLDFLNVEVKNYKITLNGLLLDGFDSNNFDIELNDINGNKYILHITLKAKVVEVTATPTSVPTSTPVPTATPTSVPTSTPVPTATPTSVPTSTPVPTATPTSVPTSTPVPTATPTSVPTSTPVPTATPTSVPTSTPVPTATPTSTPEPTPYVTVIPTVSPVVTIEPTKTPRPTARPTSTPVPTVAPIYGSYEGTNDVIGEDFVAENKVIDRTKCETIMYVAHFTIDNRVVVYVQDNLTKSEMFAFDVWYRALLNLDFSYKIEFVNVSLDELKYNFDLIRKFRNTNLMTYELHYGWYDKELMNRINNVKDHVKMMIKKD